MKSSDLIRLALGRASPLIFATALPAILLASSPASATAITGTYSNDADLTNSATGFPSGPFTLTSTSSTVSYVDFIPSQSFTLGSIDSLSATFTDTVGGAAGGAPRIVLLLNTGDFISVYLGTLPSFSESNPATFTADFSGTNLDNGTNDAGYKNSGSYKTLASFDTTYGADTVTNAYFILDGGWSTNQALTLNSINVDATPAAVPEPASLSILGAALLGFVAMWRRHKSQA